MTPQQPSMNQQIPFGLQPSNSIGTFNQGPSVPNLIPQHLGTGGLLSAATPQNLLATTQVCYSDILVRFVYSLNRS